MIAHVDGGDEKVWPSVVIKVTKRGSHADFVFKSHACLTCDVREPAAALVPPQLVSTTLIHKQQVDSSVTIHIRRGQSGPMIVVVWFETFSCFIDHLMFERNAALCQNVMKTKLVKGLPVFAGGNLRTTAFSQPGECLLLCFSGDLNGSDSFLPGQFTCGSGEDYGQENASLHGKECLQQIASQCASRQEKNLRTANGDPSTRAV